MRYRTIEGVNAYRGKNGSEILALAVAIATTLYSAQMARFLLMRVFIRSHDERCPRDLKGYFARRKWLISPRRPAAIRGEFQRLIQRAENPAFLELQRVPVADLLRLASRMDETIAT